MRILALLSLILSAISPVLATSQAQQGGSWRAGVRAELEQAERRRHQAVADSERHFGDYVIYYSVFYSSFLSPEIAEAAGITRSRNRAVVNVSVRRAVAVPSAVTEGVVVAPPPIAEGGAEPLPAIPAGLSGVAVTAELRGTVSDLVHRRPLRFQELREPGAVYYLAPLRFGHRDRLYFELQLLAEGAQQPYRLKFDRQLYVDGR